MKLGRRPLRQSPYSVNWLTTNTAAANVGHAEVHLVGIVLKDTQAPPFSPPTVGHRPAYPSARCPADTSKPRSIAPTVSPSMTTAARLRAAKTTRMTTPAGPSFKTSTD